MTRIGLLSDTHGYLDAKVLNCFTECDQIWHAGDFGTIAIAEELRRATDDPLQGVYGNIDGYDVRSVYPEKLIWMCEEVKVLMIHIGGYPKKYAPGVKDMIRQERPRLFISGHSHILKIIYDPEFECLHINPGAAGKQGWHKVRTVVRFTIDKDQIKDCEIIEL